MLIGSLYIAKISIRNWYETPPHFNECVDNGRIHRKAQNEKEFDSCLSAQAKKYLSHDYPEFKEMTKAFITLLSATLVASITFSEKVVNISSAPSIAVSALVACWFLLLSAIIACVGGLGFMANAAWIAQYDPYLNFLVSETRAVSLLMFSVGSFITALAALMTAGIISLITKSHSAVK